MLQLRQEQQVILNSLLSSVPAIYVEPTDSLIVSDEDSIIVEANEHTGMLLGCSINELVGETIGNVFPERYRGIVESMTFERENKFASLEIHVIDNSGLEISTSVIPHLTNNSYNNLTRIREHIDPANYPLEIQRVLKQQQERNERLENLLRGMGGLVHDGLGVLSSIKGFTKLLNCDLQNAGLDERNYIDYLFLSINNLGNLLNQFSGNLAESNKFIVRPNAIIEETLDHIQFYSQTTYGEKYSFIQEVDSKHKILLDYDSMGRLITNLVVNAQQAMPDGGKIAVQTYDKIVGREEEASGPLSFGEYLVLSVQDQGSGIPPEVMPHLFDAHFTTKATGSGLGLDIVKRIVDQHNAQIDVTSEPGKTTFSIYFPAIYLQ